MKNNQNNKPDKFYKNIIHDNDNEPGDLSIKQGF